MDEKLKIKQTLTRLQDYVRALRDCHDAMLRVNRKAQIHGAMVDVGLSTMSTSLWDMETLLDDALKDLETPPAAE